MTETAICLRMARRDRAIVLGLSLCPYLVVSAGILYFVIVMGVYGSGWIVFYYIIMSTACGYQIGAALNVLRREDWLLFYVLLNEESIAWHSKTGGLRKGDWAEMTAYYSSPNFSHVLEFSDNTRIVVPRYFTLMTKFGSELDKKLYERIGRQPDLWNLRFHRWT